MLLISELEKTQKSFSLFSSDLYDDLKRVLRLMGIPWVTAPYEAESQCAYLELCGLVHGVITEDSDALLFGSKKVYRNIFESNKFVEMYDSNIIKKEMGLDRSDLIKMALFMGSDYTRGVKGIAQVNAIEIINSFPDVKIQGEDVKEAEFGSGLQRFKEWVQERRVMEPSKKKNYKLEAIKEALEDSEEIEIGKKFIKIEEEYKESHKNWRKGWEFPAEFPDS